MQEITCIRVGYGRVAQIHESKMQEYGVKTVAIVETNEQKALQAQQKGFIVFNTCLEAAKLNPGFWDICVSTDQHFEIVKEIIKVAPKANILVEKPICLFSEISDFKKKLLDFQGKITVNENYASSIIKDIVKKSAIQDLHITPKKIVVEFTKNRELDFIKGRFIDNDLGALGYEGSHMVALVSALLAEDMPHNILETEFNDFVFQDSQQYLDNQGSAYIRYKSSSGVEIELYTSMMGKIKYNYPLFFTDDIPHQDQESKYRMLALHGSDCHNDQYCVVGFLEPINYFNRCQGAVYVSKNGKIEKIIAPICDDTMMLHFQKTLSYFQGKAENPYSAEMGIKIVQILHSLTTNMRNSKYLVAS
ncbi:oxidoreductase [Nostoc sp. T09]|uniref:Gfo/Idh/MocA family oxidoreductase n=1 Tax=Nostoc sp. T09 TaxID=1932621 RepID=UPI000A35DCA2|nr:Gfo/Idh/MocA family oxidoreductase [Nostoc sp. T09]OUL33330.1 oxidoreductase [Nostoc sp. T09]